MQLPFLNTSVKKFKFFEWIIYLGLFLTSIFFTRQAMEKYFSEETGIKQYEEKKTNLYHPTIIMCLGYHDRSLYKYERDFNITYAIIAEDYLTYIDNFTLSIGENDLKMSKTKVQLNEIYTLKKGICHNVRAIRNVNEQYTEIVIWSNKLQITSVKFFFTSEKNSFGITWGSFKDGKMFSFDIFHGKGKYIELVLKKNIKVKLKCGQQSFYECVGSKIIKSDFSNCSSTCMMLTFPNVEYPLCPNKKFEEWHCGNTKEWECNFNTIQNVMRNVEKNEECPTSCHTNQYSVNTNDDIYLNGETHKTVLLRYRFVAPLKAKVYEEYFIYDTNDLIGFVGGTLGLFIGFSFSNFLTCLFENIQWIILKICSRNSNAIDNDQAKSSQNRKSEENVQLEQKFTRIKTELETVVKELEEVKKLRKNAFC